MKTWACAAFVLVAMLGICRADTIHLKDGKVVLSAANINEIDGQLQFTVGGTHYSIPKSSVSSVEHGDASGISVGTSKSGWIAPSPASIPPRSSSGATNKV